MYTHAFEELQECTYYLHHACLSACNSRATNGFSLHLIQCSCNKILLLVKIERHWGWRHNDPDKSRQDQFVWNSADLTAAAQVRKSRSDKAKAVCCCSVGRWTYRTFSHRTCRHGLSSRLLTFHSRTWACALPGLVSRGHSRGKQEYSQRVNLCYLKICNT
jgi:hypothetical protein